MYGWQEEEDIQRHEMGLFTFYHKGGLTDRHLDKKGQKSKTNHDNFISNRGQYDSQKKQFTSHNNNNHNQSIKTERNQIKKHQKRSGTDKTEQKSEQDNLIPPKKQRLLTVPNPQMETTLMFQARYPARTFLNLKNQDLASSFHWEESIKTAWEEKLKNRNIVRSRLEKMREKMISIQKKGSILKLSGKNIRPLQQALHESLKQEYSRGGQPQKFNKSMLPNNPPFRPKNQTSVKMKKKEGSIKTHREQLVKSITSQPKPKSSRPKHNTNDIPFIRRFKVRHPQMKFN